MNTPADDAFDTSPSSPSSQVPRTLASPRASSSAITFGDLLRRYCMAADLTQAALAERAGLSVRGINVLERGERMSSWRETLQPAARLSCCSRRVATIHESYPNTAP